MKQILSIILSLVFATANLQATSSSSVNIDLTPLINQLDVILAEDSKRDIEIQAKKLGELIAKIAEEYGEGMSEIVIRKLSFTLKERIHNGQTVSKEKAEIIVDEVNDALAKALDQEGGIQPGLGYAVAGIVVGFFGGMALRAKFGGMRSTSNGGDAIEAVAVGVIGAIAGAFIGFVYGFTDSMSFEMEISKELDALLID